MLPIINNSETETTTVYVPNDGLIWVLNGKGGNKRATVMTLNGEEAELPCAVEVQLTCDEETTAMLTGTRLVMLMEDGTLTELPYVMEDGKLTFTLTAAGTYAFMPAAE